MKKQNRKVMSSRGNKGNLPCLQLTCIPVVGQSVLVLYSELFDSRLEELVSEKARRAEVLKRQKAHLMHEKEVSPPNALPNSESIELNSGSRFH